MRSAAAALASPRAFVASPAYAQVMDIAADGTVSVRQGAGAADLASGHAPPPTSRRCSRCPPISRQAL